MKQNWCIFGFLTMATSGVILIVLGSHLGFNRILDCKDKRVLINEMTEQFKQSWSTPMELTFKVYMFNVQNVDDIMEGAKPIVKEVGPYVYRKFRENRNVKYNEDDDTFEYMQNFRFEFDAEASAPLTEDDELTILNVALQSELQNTEYFYSLTMNSVWRHIFQDSITIFHKIKVRTILFDSYRFCDPVTLIGPQYILARVFCTSIKQRLKSNTMVIEADQAIAFSFFNHKTTADDGPYIVKAGNTDINEFGTIQSWKGLNYTDAWVDSEYHCNNIRGRDFWVYPPSNHGTSSYDIFDSDICRVVQLRTHDISSQQGIDGFVFKIGPETLSNVRDAECYCTKATRNCQGENECFPEGFGDMNTCIHIPIIISFPHFLWADSKYSSTIEGLTPNDEKHDSFVMIEPDTGLVLRGAKRMQYNMVIRPIQDIDITEKITPAVMPILWVDEVNEPVPDVIAEKIVSAKAHILQPSEV